LAMGGLRNATLKNSHDKGLVEQQMRLGQSREHTQGNIATSLLQ
jgi:hypothetical protein